MSPATCLNMTAARLRATPWRALAGLAWLSLFVFMLARLMAPAELRPAIGKAGLALPLLLLAAKDLAHLPDARRRLRAAATWPARLAALLPPELLGILKLDRLMWRGFLRWARRETPAPLPEGTALSYLNLGAYGAAFGIAMVCLFIELPIHTMLINLWIADADKRLLIHVLGGVGALVSFVWVVADRWHVGKGCHTLGKDALHLQVGARTSGAIPLNAIEACDRIELAPDAWRRRHGIERSETLLVTPFDKPNCVLLLKPGSELTILHWQVARRLPRYLLLYVDRPELLASWVESRPSLRTP